MTIGEFVSRLERLKRTARGYIACCPAHEDNTPSLSVAEGSDGRLLVMCHAKCSIDSILKAMGLEMKDLFPDNDPFRGRTSHNFPPVRLQSNGPKAPANFQEGARRISAVYSYTNAEGEVLYENLRFEPKDFKQRRPDGRGGYFWNLTGVTRVPYRLPELLAAMKKPGAEIWFTEGEKDADNLRSLDFTATSFKNWTRSFNQYIKGAHVVLFRDHDTSGLKQANEAARIIAEAAVDLKVIDLFHNEPLPDKHGKDVSHWIDDRRNEGLGNEDIAEALAVLVNGSDAWEPEVAEMPPPIGNGLKIEFLDTVTALDVSWLARPLIPFGFFTLLDGIEGIGKTYAMLDIAKRLTLGLPMPFEGERHDPANVFFLSVEDSPEYVLKPRFERMQGDCTRLAVLRGHFDFSEVGFAALESTIEAHAIKFVFIDPLFSFTGRADINKTSDVRPITDRLNQIAAKYSIAIVGVRHINKSKGFGDARNAGAHSVAWLQGCRSGLIVGHDTEDKAKRGIAQHKLNIAAESNTVYGFEINADGVFSWTGESDLSISGMLAHKTNESNDERSAIAEAIRFLKERLADGGKLKSFLDDEARGEGINQSTLNRAKTRLGIKPRKTGMDGGWFWELPATL